MTILDQLLWAFILALPVACIAWTVTHEELFREPREYFARRSERAGSFVAKKFFYLVTCEYCFSHYVALFFVGIGQFTLLYADWRGFLIAWFSVVWIANQYMSIFGRLRLDIKRERVEIEEKQEVVEAIKEGKKAA
ncbi:MAG TPA: hypothetical protein VM056_01260 [Terriglobales bacterium]|nr:hypothetical protein [Terriglobales bacterium]